MQFKATRINVNDRLYWEDLIEMAFQNNQDERLSILRITADETVYIEYNDQMNFVKACFKDIDYFLEGSSLTISISNKIHNQHLSADLKVDFHSACNNDQKKLVIQALDTLLEKSS